MGSDLYMEAQNFSPRPDRARWEGDDLVLEKDYFYHGYTEYYRGPLTPEIQQIIKRTGVKVPLSNRGLVKFRMDFTYQTRGAVMVTLNTGHYDTDEKIKSRLVAIAAEEYDISPSLVKNAKIKEI